jgi:hypothetical protein
MNKSSLRIARMTPMPRGEEPEAWLLDTTPWRRVFKVYFNERYPFYFSPIGSRVRLLMPVRGLMRVDRLLKVLEDYCHSIPDGGVSLGLHPDWTPREKATVMLAAAIYDERTNYICYTVWPDGRVVAFSGKYDPPDYARLSWHPSVAGGVS